MADEKKPGDEADAKPEGALPIADEAKTETSEARDAEAKPGGAAPIADETKTESSEAKIEAKDADAEAEASAAGADAATADEAPAHVVASV